MAPEAPMLERHPRCAGIPAVLLRQLLNIVDGVTHAQHLRQAPAVVLLLGSRTRVQWVGYKARIFIR